MRQTLLEEALTVYVLHGRVSFAVENLGMLWVQRPRQYFNDVVLDGGGL
jgi:hypothetical protein